MGEFRFSAPPPLSLYVHLPWCVRKCPYCDFNSHAAEVVPERAYVAALLADLEQELPSVWGRPVVSVFLGGGTPSLFSPEAIDALLSGIRARLPLVAEVEITLEANPGTVEAARFQGYRQAGVNRLSLGIQSLDDGALRALGRIHDAAQARAAVEAARAAGFDNVNLDLMFGLPGQDRSAGLRDLAEAIALAPEHLSWYQLTLEPHTPFAAEPPSLPEDDEVVALWEDGLERLAAAGYRQYEVSAHAQGGRRCRHNLNYWTFGDYLGIGAGAHGKLTDAPSGVIRRYHKQRRPERYLRGAGGAGRIRGERVLTAEEVAFEYLMNALRLDEGFTVAHFEARTGLPFSQVRHSLEALAAEGWLLLSERRVKLSSWGRRYLDDVLARCLPENH